ncbi:MAG: cohesin domain-containing protein [Bacteroidota bacterium]
MKSIRILLISGFLLFSCHILSAVNAPITTAGKVTNASAGLISVPITVNNFLNVGGISLTFTYDQAVMTYSSATTNGALTDMTVNGATAGTITISWLPLTPGEVNLPDDAHLVDLTFTYISGMTALVWDVTTPGACEYTDGGGLNPLNDTPKSTYYIDGLVLNHAAPITVAPVITNAGATVSAPIKVYDFNNIGTITLTLLYDTSVLTYNSATPNSVFTTAPFNPADFTVDGSNPGIVTISWSDLTNPTQQSISNLPDGTSIVDLEFSLSTSLGTYSKLTWDPAPGLNEYADDNNIPLYDEPLATYYQEGLIAGQLSPITSFAPLLNKSAGAVSVPVLVENLDNIGVISLTFTYDPALLTYNGTFTPNSAFNSYVPGSFTVDGTTDGLIKISFSDFSSIVPVSIPDGQELVTLDFSFSTAAGNFSNLTWDTLTNGACEYTDINGNPYYDAPKSSYYINGAVSGPPAPQTKIIPAEISAIVGESVSVPVKVYNFTTIGGLSLVLDYDPAVLTYLSYTINPLIDPLDITVDGTVAGRLTISWSDDTFLPLTIPDGQTMVTFTFTYKGGTTTLKWTDEGGSCEYADGVMSFQMYDLPTGDYYFNGCISTAVVLNTKVFLEGPYSGGGNMSATLNTGNLIPLTQPFNTSPWNYTGTENVVSIPADVTDWILVELRTGTASSTSFFKCAGFLKKNGQIVGLDGTSALVLSSVVPGSYYIVIRHRNHLAIMSAAGVSLSTSSALYDFSTDQAKAYGTNPMVALTGGGYGMFTGDANSDGHVFTNDFTLWRQLLGTSGVYTNSDFNMDGNVFTNDFTKFRANLGNSTTVPN